MRSTLRKATVVSILSIALLCIWSIFTFDFNLNSARASSAVFSISSTIANPNSNAEVIFSLEQDSNICSFQLQFTYDDTLLELVSAETNEAVQNNFVINTTAIGLITLNYSQTENFVAKTDFVTLVFAVQDVQLGTSISLEVSKSYSNCAFTAVVGGTSEIENLSYKLGQIKIGLIGDVNQDNVVDSNDASAIQLHIAGKAILGSTQLPFADVNGDGVVRIDDSTRLQMFLIGKIDSLEPVNYLSNIDTAFSNLYNLNSFKAVTARTENGGTTQANYSEMSYLNTPDGYNARIDRDSELLLLLHDSTAYHNNGNFYTVIPNFERANILNLISSSSDYNQYKLAAILLSDINLKNCFSISRSENGYIARAITENIINLAWANYSKNIDKIASDFPSLAGITIDYFKFLNQIDLKFTYHIENNIPKNIKTDLYIPRYVYKQLGIEQPNSSYIYNTAIQQNAVTNIELPPNLPTVPTETKQQKEQDTINSFKSKLTTESNYYSLDIKADSNIDIENASIISGVILALSEPPLSSYEIIKGTSHARSLSQVKNNVVLWSFAPQKSLELFGIDSAVTVSIDSQRGEIVSHSIYVGLRPNNGASGNLVIKIIPLTIEQELLLLLSKTAQLSTYRINLPQGQEIIVDKTSNYAKSVDMSSVVGFSNNSLYYSNMLNAKTRKAATIDEFFAQTYNIQDVLNDAATGIIDVVRENNVYTTIRENGKTSIFIMENDTITKVVTTQARQLPPQIITISEDLGTLTPFHDADYATAKTCNVIIDINGEQTTHKFEINMPIIGIDDPTVLGKTFYRWSLDGVIQHHPGDNLSFAADATLTAVFCDEINLDDQCTALATIRDNLDRTASFVSYGSEFSSSNYIKKSIIYSSMNRLTSDRSSYARITRTAAIDKYFSYEIISRNQHYYLDQIDKTTTYKAQYDCTHDFDILKLASSAIEYGELLGKYGNNYFLSYGAHRITITASLGKVTGLSFTTNKSVLGSGFTSTTSHPMIEYVTVDHSSEITPLLAEFAWL